VHEFRGLVLFALEKYPEAAAADYAVLSAGPGWDWTTMSGLYVSVDTYTEQLRKLESFAKANPKSGDAHFLLGYHYMTAGHKDASVEQFKAAQQLVPDDRLLQQLAGVTQPPAKSTASPAAASDVPADKVLTLEAVTGKWTASRDGSTFEMELKESAEFTWTFSAGPGTQTVSGVFAVDKNILAMEVSDGTAMIAEVKMRGANGFSFKLVGGDANDPGLVFSRAK
jgi:tetratricopeptide (TPR) repeat protein